VPRKNGKSDVAARVGNAMLTADDEYGAEVYSGATTEKQAWEVFRPARLMALKQDEFRAHYGVEVNAKSIVIPRNGSRFEPIIGDPGDGASPSCAIVDEYHEHDTDRLYDTMETGMGAREQPLMLMITTAGDNMAGPCYALQKESERVLSGEQTNDELFALIYTIDDTDQWDTVEALKKANPNYDVSVSSEFLQSRLQDAINNSRKQGVFKTKHLNIWVGAREAYYNVEWWKACKQDTRLEDYEGELCFVGMDLASKVDIAALELIFPLDGKYVRFGKYYLPEAALEPKENEHYRGWAADGWLTITEGNIIDFNEIKSDILDLSSKYQIDEVAYDPHQATMLVTELMKEGVKCIEVRPTVLNFSEPMKELDGLMKDKRIIHNGDPIMSWMVSNVVAKEDAKDNVYPRKEQERNKIDGVIAHLMALNRALNYKPKSKSIYNSMALNDL
jgi:phage terminase large subunit-like protein